MAHITNFGDTGRTLQPEYGTKCPPTCVMTGYTLEKWFYGTYLVRRAIICKVACEMSLDSHVGHCRNFVGHVFQLKRDIEYKMSSEKCPKTAQNIVSQVSRGTGGFMYKIWSSK